MKSRHGHGHANNARIMKETGDKYQINKPVPFQYSIRTVIKGFLLFANVSNSKQDTIQPTIMPLTSTFSCAWILLSLTDQLVIKLCMTMLSKAKQQMIGIELKTKTNSKAGSPANSAVTMSNTPIPLRVYLHVTAQSRPDANCVL